MTFSLIRASENVSKSTKFPHSFTTEVTISFGEQEHDVREERVVNQHN